MDRYSPKHVELQTKWSIKTYSVKSHCVSRWTIYISPITSAERTAVGWGPVSSDSHLNLLHFLCCRQLIYLRRSVTMWPNHSWRPWWIRWWADEQLRNWCLVQTKSHLELPVIYRWFNRVTGFVRMRVAVLVAAHHISHFPAGCYTCHVPKYWYNELQIFCKLWSF